MDATPQLILLKTKSRHFVEVTEHQKHALDKQMRKAQKGALLIIAEMQGIGGPALARYAMWFKSQRSDDGRESEAIWKTCWPFIVDGERGDWLTNPFKPAEIKPNGPYGRGGTLVYVRSEDAEDFRREGRLAPFL